MKRAIFALFLLIYTASVAQKFSAGIKAGVNFSNFTGGNFEAVKKKAIAGFHGGVFSNFLIGSLSVQPEVLISIQGARIDSINRSYDWKVTYATIPVLLKYKSALSFYLEAGPQFGFKFIEEVTDESIKGFARNLDLSAAVGLGIQTNAGLGIGARYLVGLSKVGKFDPPINIDPDFKNSVIQISTFITLGK